jgi:23S rRNA pseudouridine1911/1915/1917 synthase
VKFSGPRRKVSLVTRVKLPPNELVRPSDVPEGAVVSVFRVPPEVAGQRLDVFLQSQLRRTSRTRAQLIVRASAFDRAGRRLRPNDRVQAEQHVFLWRAPWDEDPVPRDIPILHEDEHLLAVDKPANLPVHPTARYHHNTLIKILQRERPGQFLSLGHRIDRETSGVLLVSKTSECDRALKRMLEERDDVGKEYVAITWGVPDDGSGRRAFRCEKSLELDPSSALRVKMRLGETPSALAATTDFVVDEVRSKRDGRRYARVRCVLHTGRQHQIRVHLASYGTPIVGDKLYGPDEGMFARHADGDLTDEDRARLELSRHALHAARLELPHPITGAPLAIEAPLADDLVAFWNALS